MYQECIVRRRLGGWLIYG